MSTFSAWDSNAISQMIASQPGRRFFIVRVVPGIVTHDYLATLFKTHQASILDFNAHVNTYRLHSALDLVERFKGASWCLYIEEDKRPHVASL